MANIPGALGVLPSVVTDVVTRSGSVSIQGGIRLLAIIGEGERQEVIVSSALGGGQDGFDGYFSATGDPVGRFFALNNAPIISNRTKLFRNGRLLSGLEEEIDQNTFSNSYDYRIDIETGHIEMQRAHLVDLGGAFYTAGSTNIGDGYLDGYSGIRLLDDNAPSETWTIKCVSVQRNGMNQPISGTARFVAFGSVSGNKLDANGNVVVWLSNGQEVDNSILSFNVNDDSVVFREGDFFTIKVSSGVLTKNDSLTAQYIAETDINDPEFFDSMSKLTVKHGLASVDHPLSLGAQLAFANQPPGVYALQAAPPVPRRTSLDLLPTINASSLNQDEFIIPFPNGVTPDIDSLIHFFVTSPSTGVETQLLPNKFEYYTLGTGGNPSVNTFIFDDNNPPAGNSFSYSVIDGYENLAYGFDGYINPSSPTVAVFSTASIVFDSSYVSKKIKILDATNGANNGTFTITDVSGGNLVLSAASTVAEHNIHFEIFDENATSSFLVINHNIVPNGNALRITYIDSRDASFFDAGWEGALEALEKVDVDIVVPLPTQTKSLIFQNTLAHCRTMSNNRNKKERVLYTGAIRGLLPENLIGEEDAAVEDIGILEGIQGDEVSEVLAANTEDLTNYSVSDAFGSTFRAVYFYPDEIVVSAGGENTKVDGFYIAAAAAGFTSGINNISIPLTNKVLTGFTILRDKQFSQTRLEQLAAAGVTTLEPVAGGGRVIWGKTTTQSGFPEEEEISIVFIRDRIAKSMRAGFAGFIGLPQDEDIIPIFTARATSLLRAFISQKLITDYADLIVEQDSVEPRQINISVAVSPIYPINWVYIKISVGTL